MLNRRHILRAGVASAAVIASPRTLRLSVAASAKSLSGVHSVTFTVDDVEPGTTALPLRPTKAAIEAILSAPNSPLESWTRDTPSVILARSDVNPFLSAVTTAYHNHFPLTLSPDMVWLQVLGGLASHVNANGEALRHHFVAHKGKKLIEIRRDEFRRGNPDNDWEGAFAEFSAKMRPHIGAANHDLIASGFSTTGPVESAAMNVALMDAMQSYFVYGMTTSCGFPSVTLEGTEDDWRDVRDRAAELVKFDLAWWTDHLVPILDQFIETSAGRPDKDFWCNFYKLQPVGSGTPYIHGHVVNLFPYFGKSRPTKKRLVEDFEVFIRNTQMSRPRSEAEILREITEFSNRLTEDSHHMQDTLRRNPFIGRTDMGAQEGMTTADVTTKMNSAPMVWNYLGEMLQMELLAGFIGATQDPDTLAIRPKIGWAVREGIG